MKKALILTLVMVFAFAALIVGNAEATVEDTWHDFSTNSWTWTALGDGDLLDTETTQTCVFCHHPHRTAGGGTIFTNMVLWNQVEQDATYATYNSTTSSTINGTAFDITNSGDSARSYLCMACHDGDIATDSLVAAPGDGSNIDLVYNLGTLGVGDLGTTLEDDHPVNITYANLVGGNNDDGLSDVVVDGVIAGLYPLFNNTLQCATCHDVHDGDSTASTGVQFMRGNTWEANSKICVDCHIDK